MKIQVNLLARKYPIVRPTGPQRENRSYTPSLTQEQPTFHHTILLLREKNVSRGRRLPEGRQA
jgi:hypothetical protein